MPKVILAAVLLLFADVGSAKAADGRILLTPRQDDIMRLVGQLDGYLTAALHKEFWDDFPENIAEDRKSRMRLAVDFNYLPEVYGIFQRELWQSAKLSLDKGELLSTPGYASAKQNLLLFTEIAAFEAPAFVAAVEQADQVLKSAASKVDYVAAQGAMRIDEAFVDKVLAGMDAAQSRLARLLSPDYPDQPREWKYPEGHFRIFWPDPLVESRVAIPDGGYGKEVVVYANRYDRDAYVSVQFLSLLKPESDPVRALVYGKLVASQMGFRNVAASVAEWEGRVSALVSGKAVLENRETELSLRLALAPEHQGAWVLICLVQDQPGLAEALRINLDSAVRPE